LRISNLNKRNLIEVDSLEHDEIIEQFIFLDFPPIITPPNAEAFKILNG